MLNEKKIYISLCQISKEQYKESKNDRIILGVYTRLYERIELIMVFETVYKQN